MDYLGKGTDREKNVMPNSTENKAKYQDISASPRIFDPYFNDKAKQDSMNEGEEDNLLNTSEVINGFDCIKQIQVTEDSNKDEEEWVKQFESNNGVLNGAVDGVRGLKGDLDADKVNDYTQDDGDDLMQATYE